MLLTKCMPFAPLELQQVDNLLTMGEKEEADLKIRIKATIAKNIWDDNIYFKILSEDDEYILKAVQVLD